MLQVLDKTSSTHPATLPSRNLRLDRVSKSYGEGLVVDEVSLEIIPGEFIALLGPSGCGKSTILRMIAGFETLTGGSISNLGRVLADDATHVPPEKRNMGMVFQSYALWPHMTVAENVGYPLKVRKLPRNEYVERVAEALDLVQLAPFAKRLPRDLSGGQRQRVALARCLVMEPDVILLDEPLANLDRHLKAAMEETFRSFHHRVGATMIYVTHDQSEAMAMADRIAVLDKGRLVQCDEPREIYRRPRNEIVANLIGNRSFVDVAGSFSSPHLDAASTMAAVRALEGAPRERSGNGSRLLVRPEHVHRDEHGVLATVRECIYRGERYAVTLALPDGQPLPFFTEEPMRHGEEVRVSIHESWVVGGAAEAGEAR